MFDFVPDTYVVETECGHTVIDPYVRGPFYGRQIQDRVDFIYEFFQSAHDEDIIDDTRYEAAVLSDIVAHVEANVGEEWTSYIYVEEGDEEWFLEGFANEGLDTPSMIGSIMICGTEYTIWR